MGVFTIHFVNGDLTLCGLNVVDLPILTPEDTSASNLSPCGDCVESRDTIIVPGTVTEEDPNPVPIRINSKGNYAKGKGRHKRPRSTIEATGK